jgi:hypothetical membrane protein
LERSNFAQMRAETGETMSRQRMRLCLIAGAIAPVLFMLVATVDGFTKPGYDARRDFISDLALGPHGWVQSANFIVVGLLLIAFAAGLRQLFPTGRASLFGPALVGLIGLCVVASGFFRTDPSNYPAGADTTTTARGAVHEIAFAIVLVSVIASCFVFARRFRQEPAWHGYGLYSIITAVLVVLLAVVAPGPGQSLTGIVQRILVATFFLWFEVIALRALRLVTRVDAQRIDDKRMSVQP